MEQCEGSSLAHAEDPTRRVASLEQPELDKELEMLACEDVHYEAQLGQAIQCEAALAWTSPGEGLVQMVRSSGKSRARRECVGAMRSAWMQSPRLERMESLA